MKDIYNKLDQKVHTTPGSFLYTGTRDTELKIRFSQYSKDKFQIIDLDSLDNFDYDADEYKVNWLHITGLNNIEELDGLTDQLEIHPLVMEDILDVSNDSKLEDYGDYLFTIAKNIFYNGDMEVKTDQISLLLYEDLVISLEEVDSGLFENVYKRIREASSIRKYNSDYLLYSLLDAIVDNYFFLIGQLGRTIDLLEDKLLLSPDKALLDDIYKVKRDIIYIRNILWPMRNLISNITRNYHTLIAEATVYYFRDIYDNIVQLVDLTETSREICSGMLGTYLSSVGNKTNEIMKVLTIASTISIPLTFLTGVYGMNFQHFPSLSWKYAYPAFWVTSALVTLAMIKFFQKKNWI